MRVRVNGDWNEEPGSLLCSALLFSSLPLSLSSLPRWPSLCPSLSLCLTLFRGAGPGVVQTVWRSAIDKPGRKHRAEVLVRFNEGGGWFNERKVVRIGSTGKDPQPLWHSFPPAVRDVSAAVARKKQEDGLTIEDVLAGKTSKEQAAWMQVQRLRETAGTNVFSQVRMQPLAARWLRHTWARLAAGSMVFFTVFLYPLVLLVTRSAG